jgi:hypothetical protein
MCQKWLIHREYLYKIHYGPISQESIPTTHGGKFSVILCKKLINFGNSKTFESDFDENFF